MSYSEEDVGFLVISLVGIWILLCIWILGKMDLSNLQIAAIMIPSGIGLFLFWVRYENKKIAKAEAEAEAMVKKAKAAEGEAKASSAAPETKKVK